jgi:hypothetical protein
MDQREGTGFHSEIIEAISSRDRVAIRRYIIDDLTTGRDRLEMIVSLEEQSSPADSGARSGERRRLVPIRPAT